MAWVESHQTLDNHPKLIQACASLKIGRPQMIGHLHLLWHWCLDYAVDGDLSRYKVQQLATVCGWDHDAETFVMVLSECGFLDQKKDGFKIHDWLDFCGEIARKRMIRKSTIKQRTAEIVSQIPPKTAKFRQNPSYRTVPDLTVPNQKKENTLAQAPKRAPFSKPSVEEIKVYCQTNGYQLDAQHFWDHYEANGWRVGRNPMKDWQAAIRTWMRSEFRTEGKNGTHERKSIFGLPDQKSGEGGHRSRHSDLRKVPSVSEILAGVGTMPLSQENRREKPDQ